MGGYPAMRRLTRRRHVCPLTTVNEFKGGI